MKISEISLQQACAEFLRSADKSRNSVGFVELYRFARDFHGIAGRSHGNEKLLSYLLFSLCLQSASGLESKPLSANSHQRAIAKLRSFIAIIGEGSYADLSQAKMKQIAEALPVDVLVE